MATIFKPFPEVKKFTLSCRKAVATVPTDLGSVTKKPPGLPVTIVISKR